MTGEIKNKQLRELAAACEIFDKYVPEGAYVEIHGEHDEIMLGGVHEEDVSSEDSIALEELGWAWRAKSTPSCFTAEILTARLL